MIAELSASYPVELLCTALDCPRSSYYYQAVPTSDAALVTAIEQIVIRWPRYGYRWVTAQLRRVGWTVNSKAVRCQGRVRLSAKRRFKKVLDRLYATDKNVLWHSLVRWGSRNGSPPRCL